MRSREFYGHNLLIKDSLPVMEWFKEKSLVLRQAHFVDPKNVLVMKREVTEPLKVMDRSSGSVQSRESPSAKGDFLQTRGCFLNSGALPSYLILKKGITVMDEIKDRLSNSSDACIKAYEAWKKSKSVRESRETLQEAVHELRKVASRLEIEMAVSEREEMASKPIPVPTHRASQTQKKRGGQSQQAEENSVSDQENNEGGKTRQPQQRRRRTSSPKKSEE